MISNPASLRWTVVLGLLVGSACGGTSEEGAAEPGQAPAVAGAPADGDTPFATLADYFDPEEYADRRARLAEEAGGGAVLLLGSKDPMDAWDEHRFDPYFRIREFKQTEPMIYLTGLEEPGAVVLFHPERASVFLPDGGEGEGARERLASLGLDDVQPLSAFEEALGAEMAAGPLYVLQRERAEGGVGFGTGERFSDLLPSLAAGTLPEDLVAERIRVRFPGSEVRNLLPALRRTWKAKSPAELRVMRDVAQISVGGLIEGLRYIRPGVSDREIAGRIEGEMRRRGAQRLAYSADIQSGPNLQQSFVALFRDYDAQNRIMQAGEHVLVDHSAEFNYHVSDIARTVPVNGSFSPEYRALYELYLVAHWAGLEATRPGNSWSSVGNAAAQAVADRLGTLEEEWLREAAERFVSRYSREGAGPGHFLGTSISIHSDQTSALVPGQVIAYEMVLSSPERGLRVTLEDVVAVTEDGHEILSVGLPTTVVEVEAIVGSAYRSP